MRDDSSPPNDNDTVPTVPMRLADVLLEAAELLGEIAEAALRLESLLVDAARRGVTP